MTEIQEGSKVARAEACKGCGNPIKAGLIRDVETDESYHFLCLVTGQRKHLSYARHASTDEYARAPVKGEQP